MVTNYEFWRPSIFAIGIGVLVVALCSYLQNSAPQDGIRQSGVLSELTFPAAKLSPEEVIRLQIEALRDESKGAGALQCYCFAAPSNRMMTGPLPRFAQMVREPPFDALGKSAAYTIGAVERQGDRAQYLVYVVGKNQRMSVFRWGLRKHSEPPFANCWLTVGVVKTFDSEPSERSARRDVPGETAIFFRKVASGLPFLS